MDYKNNLVRRQLIKKAVIPVAGQGTRLLPITKTQPKEMLPLFSSRQNGKLLLKPIIQLIFEQLFSSGIRDFCFIVGKNKRIIEDYFSPNYSFLTHLSSIKKTTAISDFKEFYKKIEKSTITFISQTKPLGYGHAVSLAASFVGKEQFLVHAGDTLIISPNNTHISLCMSTNADGVIALQKVIDPKPYGVILGQRIGKFYNITRAIEKPKKYISNLAIMPVNSFHYEIFNILKKIKPGKGNEIQLTDAIQKMIDLDFDIKGFQIHRSSLHFDIGTSENYWHAQKLSKKLSDKRLI
tara:strand:- start:2634 stop:3518 length:885 start_codon:yes stop_codon:yes gene_type:complete